MRRDDGVGAAVIEALARTVTDVDIDLLVLGGEATALIDAWSQRSLTIVIDAVRSGAVEGTVHRLGADPACGSVWQASATTHGFGLMEAMALGRVLGREPGRLVVYGVEAGDLGHGSGLSLAVASSVPGLVDQITRELELSADPR